MSADPELLRWAEPTPQGDVVAHPFAVRCSSGNVPGIAWYGARPAASRWPLVLLGHGGSSHKASTRNVRLAIRLVQDFKINAVALDGPFHGARSPGPAVDYQALIANQGVGVVTHRVVEEWLDVLHGLTGDGQFAFGPLGYFGLSMGSRFGIPLAGRLGDRLNVAVLGKFGARHSGVLHPGLNDPEQILSAARGVTAPTLFHIERHDEVFPLDQQVALFDTIASQDKTLCVREGQHGTSRPDDETIWLDFLARHLTLGTHTPGNSRTTCL